RIGAGSQRLACAVAVVTVARIAGPARKQGAFGEALRVQHGIVAIALQAPAQGADLSPGGAVEQMMAPAADGEEGHVAGPGGLGRDRGETFLDQPVAPRAGAVPAQIVDDRKIVYDSAQGRGVDEEDALGRLRSRGCAYNSDHSPIIR